MKVHRRLTTFFVVTTSSRRRCNNVFFMTFGSVARRYDPITTSSRRSSYLCLSFGSCNIGKYFPRSCFFAIILLSLWETRKIFLMFHSTLCHNNYIFHFLNTGYCSGYYSRCYSGNCSRYLNWINFFFFWLNFFKEKYKENKFIESPCKIYLKLY